MPIDMHAHWVPKEVSALLRTRSAAPMIRVGDNGQEHLHSLFRAMPIQSDFDDLNLRITEMDRHGVQRAVLSLTTVLGVEALPLADALPLCRAHNDAASAVCVAHPDRFSAFAAVPVADLAVGLAEFERAMDLPGIVGALLPGDGFLSAKRAERFRPFFEAANRRNAIFLVHYGKLADDAEPPRLDTSDNAHARVGTLDMQARLSQNMLTFCMTDFLKPYPNVTVLSHNLGGNIAFEVDRMDHRSMLDRPTDELPSKRIRAAHVLVDCNSLGARAIEMAVEAYGAEKIVFGSDGTDFGMKWTNDAIAGARIPDAAKRAILDGNAAAAVARVKTPALAAAAE